jgi:hypothetical protein
MINSCKTKVFSNDDGVTVFDDGWQKDRDEETPANAGGMPWMTVVTTVCGPFLQEDEPRDDGHRASLAAVSP